MRNQIAMNQEQRQTAQAAATRGGARGTSEETSGAIIEKARTGKLDTSDNASDAEIEALAQAEQAEKLAKVRK